MRPRRAATGCGGGAGAGWTAAAPAAAAWGGEERPCTDHPRLTVGEAWGGVAEVERDDGEWCELSEDELHYISIIEVTSSECPQFCMRALML